MNKSTGMAGTSLCEVVFIVFLILKLCKVIDWSWWWVASPIWIMAGIAIVVALIGCIIVIIGRTRMHRWERKFTQKESKKGERQ